MHSDATLLLITFYICFKRVQQLFVIYSEVKKNQAKYFSLNLQLALTVPHFIILNKTSHENFQISICANSFQDF